MSNFFLCIGWNYIVLNFWKHYTHKHPKTSLCYLHYMPWLVAIAICNNWQAMTLSLFCSFMITNSKWAHNLMAAVCKHSIVSAKQRLNNLCKFPHIASAPILYVWSRTFAKPYMRKVFSQLNKLYIYMYVCIYMYTWPYFAFLLEYKQQKAISHMVFQGIFFMNLNTLVATPLWGSCEVTTHTPENGTWESLTHSQVLGWTHLRVQLCWVAESWDLRGAPDFQH